MLLVVAVFSRSDGALSCLGLIATPTSKDDSDDGNDNSDDEDEDAVH
jgi:hypothetical protein